MKCTLLIAALAGMLVHTKCGSQEPATATANNSPLVILETRGCRGFCPIYKLVFHNDGRVAYEGLRNMLKMGTDTIHLTSDELKHLKTDLKKLNLYQYPEQIQSLVMDAPGATITVMEGGKLHSVSGTIDRPEPILAFEELMKDLAEAHGLKVKNGVNPYEAPANQKEIIVKFNPDINPGNFMMQFDQIQLRIVKRVTAENIWVIGYNPDQISEAKLIDLMKSKNGVLDAAPLRQK